jgi:SAM-dependent methyltransferase
VDVEQPSRESASRSRKIPRVVGLARRLLDWENSTSRGPRGLIRGIVKSYLTWNRTLLLDPWLRYSIPVRVLRSMFKERTIRILDVGSGNAGLAHFLDKEVVGVDVRFSIQEFVRLRPPLLPVRASATMLPFRNRSFEAVVSMDLLEHLPHGDRPPAIAEMFRACRSLVILGFPYGRLSQEFDREALVEEMRRGGPPDWREEHVLNGLPTEEVHQAILEEANRRPGTTVRWRSHEGLRALRLRWKLAFLVPKSSRLYGPIHYPLYAIHSRLRPRTAYRRIYVVSFVDD